MQYLEISEGYEMSDLVERVGYRNVDEILALNDLKRTPELYDSMQEKYEEIYETTSTVDWKRKSALLNSVVSDSDVFEKAALMDEPEWKIFSQLNTFENYLLMPETITLEYAEDVLGNGIPVKDTVYDNTVNCLYYTESHSVDPAIFITYSSIQNVINSGEYVQSTNVMTWFNIPWGEITLYSSLTGDSIDFPVYPEEIKDSVDVTYDTMPDLLYNYEPWYVFSSTGPREVPFTFKFHRDMWSGDHRDGAANKLIRFCESCQYANYDGASVTTDIVTMYIKGKNFITGIMTDYSVSWDGPLGQDGWYLVCELSFTIREVSQKALSNTAIRKKELIS